MQIDTFLFLLKDFDKSISEALKPVRVDRLARAAATKKRTCRHHHCYPLIIIFIPISHLRLAAAFSETENVGAVEFLKKLGYQLNNEEENDEDSTEGNPQSPSVKVWGAIGKHLSTIFQAVIKDELREERAVRPSPLPPNASH